MIIEMVIIFILLFFIIGLVYQFMPDIFLMVMIIALLYYAIHLTIQIIAWKRKAPQSIRKTGAAVVKKEKPVRAAGIDPEVQKIQTFVQNSLKQGYQAATIKFSQKNSKKYNRKKV